MTCQYTHAHTHIHTQLITSYLFEVNDEDAEEEHSEVSERSQVTGSSRSRETEEQDGADVDDYNQDLSDGLDEEGGEDDEEEGMGGEKV